MTRSERVFFNEWQKDTQKKGPLTFFEDKMSNLYKFKMRNDLTAFFLNNVTS